MLSMNSKQMNEYLDNKMGLPKKAQLDRLVSKWDYKRCICYWKIFNFLLFSLAKKIKKRVKKNIFLLLGLREKRGIYQTTMSNRFNYLSSLLIYAFLPSLSKPKEWGRIISLLLFPSFLKFKKKSETRMRDKLNMSWAYRFVLLFPVFL